MTPREKELSRQLEQCQQALAESHRENALLRQKVDLLVKRVFGASSEPLDRNQLEFRSGLAINWTPWFISRYVTLNVDDRCSLCTTFVYSVAMQNRL